MAFNPNYSILTRGSENLANSMAGLGRGLGQGISDATKGYMQGQRAQENQQQQAQMQELVGLAMGGDPNALAQLGGANPELAMKIENRNAEQQQAATLLMKDNTIKAVERLYKAPDDQKDALAAEMVNDPSLDIDEKDLDLIRDDNVIRAMLVDAKGEEYTNAFMGATPKSTPMTDYQSAMIRGGDADRELRKLEAENKRFENKLKAETNQVKLDELKNKVAANKDKQLQIKKGRTEAAESVVDSGKSTLGLISEIQAHPGLSAAVGAKGASSLFGALDSPLSGTDAAGVNALIETLEAQNFLTAIGQFKSAGGAGALSDNEGKKLGAALSNLSTSQSEKDFNKSLNIIKNLVNKQISRASKQLDPSFSLGTGSEKEQAVSMNDNIDLSKLSLEELKVMRGNL